MNAFQAALPAFQVVDLGRIHARDLEVLLKEEIDTWQNILNWDFAPSAELVLRFVNMQSLSGFALIVDGRVEGYTYYIVEDHKGLIGNVFLRPAFRVAEYENILIESSLRALMAIHGIRRVETQLMMLTSPLARRMPLARWLQVFPRTFMRKPLRGELEESPVSRYVSIESWKEQWQNEAAQLIVDCYRNHMDSRINDQYRVTPGARKFLVNIIQYPGCGRFFTPASLMAFRKDNGVACGIVLASLVSPDAGHITQVAVAPGLRGHGLGYELLRRSIAEMQLYGCSNAGLTVTSSNVTAMRLYERMGFVVEREFAAHVWEGF